MSFDQSIERIGFACKYMHPDQTQKPKILKEIQSKYTEAQTTVAWLKRQTREVAEQKASEAEGKAKAEEPTCRVRVSSETES